MGSERAGNGGTTKKHRGNERVSKPGSKRFWEIKRLVEVIGGEKKSTRLKRVSLLLTTQKDILGLRGKPGQRGSSQLTTKRKMVNEVVRRKTNVDPENEVMGDRFLQLEQK